LSHKLEVGERLNYTVSSVKTILLGYFTPSEYMVYHKSSNTDEHNAILTTYTFLYIAPITAGKIKSDPTNSESPKAVKWQFRWNSYCNLPITEVLHIILRSHYIHKTLWLGQFGSTFQVAGDVRHQPFFVSQN